MGTTRRQAIIVTGAAGAAYLITRNGAGELLAVQDALAQATPQCVLTAEQTAGPYFNDEKLNRSDIRPEPSTGDAVPGIPLTLGFVVLDNDSSCAPIEGAQVDVWHCNARGDYSGESANNSGSGVGSTVGLKYLRGFQTTDADGKCSFTTIFPGFYNGRTVHIHFKVRSGNDEFSSQLYFDESVTNTVQTADAYRGNNGRVRNSADGIYGNDGARLLVDVTGDNARGYAGTFTVGLTGFASGGTPDSVVSAAVGKARFERTRTGGRRLLVEVAAYEDVAVDARLVRGGKVIARKRISALAAGAQRLVIKVPRRAARGGARLKVTLTDAAGNAKTVGKAVTVPKPRDAR